MPTPTESDRLNDICDQIEYAVLEERTEFDAVNSLFLARSTWSGIRELAFRVHDPEIAHKSLQQLLKSQDWEFEWQYEMSHDPAWQDAGYFFKLFPLAEGEDS